MSETILSGNRRALSQAITLIESQNVSDQKKAKKLIRSLSQYRKRALRIGITGPPGAGKSSLINTLGLICLKHCRSLAVLSIDPSSLLSHGSLLGDKTRMQQLARQDSVFIRSSPSKGSLGGLGIHTAEALLLCECAGYPVIFIESVGTGQSELDISQLVDYLILVVPPLGGDELQAMKKGLSEWVHCIVINKADGEFRKWAEKTRLMYQQSMRITGHSVPVLCISTLESTGIEQLWEFIESSCSSSVLL